MPQQGSLPTDGMCWHRVRVHAVTGPGTGWYACFHVVARSRSEVERVLGGFAAFLGIESMTVDEWLGADVAHQHERRGIRQEGGRIQYDESCESGSLEAVRYVILREPFASVGRWLWRRRIGRFNAHMQRSSSE